MFVCKNLCVGICGVNPCVLCMHARMAFSMCVHVCVRMICMCVHVCVVCAYTCVCARLVCAYSVHTHARGFKRSETYAYAVEECQKRPKREAKET